MNEVANVATGLIIDFNLVGKKALMETPMVSEGLFVIGHKGEPKEAIIVIDPKSGVVSPVVEGELQPEGKVIHLSSPLQYLCLLKDEAAEFRLTLVGTSNHTYYHFIMKSVVFVIKVPNRSRSIADATLNLFMTNLYHGEEHFNRMANCYPRLFEVLFQLGYDQPTTLPFELASSNGTLVPSKLYLYPQAPSRNILSVGGQCLDIDLAVFPGSQIERGVRGYRDPLVELAKRKREVEEKKLRAFLRGGSKTMVTKPVQKKKANQPPRAKATAQ